MDDSIFYLIFDFIFISANIVWQNDEIVIFLDLESVLSIQIYFPYA